MLSLFLSIAYHWKSSSYTNKFLLRGRKASKRQISQTAINLGENRSGGKCKKVSEIFTRVIGVTPMTGEEIFRNRIRVLTSTHLQINVKELLKSLKRKIRSRSCALRFIFKLTACIADPGICFKNINPFLLRANRYA